MIKAFFIVLFIAVVIHGTAHSDELPNGAVTPGAARAVDLVTLCTTSTKLVRNVPPSEKNQVYKNYGLAGNHTGYCSGKSGCEVDHLISLELGGSNDIKNLWPQPYDGECNAHIKDKLENKLHQLVCKKAITITEAQQAISTNWEDAYIKYVNPHGCK